MVYQFCMLFVRKDYYKNKMMVSAFLYKYIRNFVPLQLTKEERVLLRKTHNNNIRCLFGHMRTHVFALFTLGSPPLCPSRDSRKQKKIKKISKKKNFIIV